MKPSISITKNKFEKTANVLNYVTSKELSPAFSDLLSLAEISLQEKKKKETIAYLESLAASVLIFRKVLKAPLVSKILNSIITDAFDNNLVLPRIIYTPKASCGRNSQCIQGGGRTCAKIIGVGGCGTVPNPPTRSN